MAKGPARYAEPFISVKRVFFENAFAQKHQPACKPGSGGHHSREWYV